MKTILPVPGHREKYLVKCRDFDPDITLLDLEDSVPEQAKGEARKLVREHFQRVDHVRVNLGSYPDAALVNELECVTWVPKVEHPGQLNPYNWLLVPIVETPKAVQCVRDFARDERVFAIAIGTWDLCAELGADPSSDTIRYARARVVLAAAEAGIPAYDAPTDSTDLQTVTDEFHESRRNGFSGKGVFRPSYLGQIDYPVPRRRPPSSGEPIEIVEGRVVGPPMRRMECLS